MEQDHEAEKGSEESEVPKTEDEETACSQQQPADPEEEPSKSKLQQKTESERCRLKFQFNKKKHGLTCNTSQTVLDALNTHADFRSIREANQGKEIVIRKEEGKGASINTDFPCKLLKSTEILNITFIKSKQNAVQQQKNAVQQHSCHIDDFVIFNIKTRGAKGIRCVMRNNELAKSDVLNVCVYAFKGENFKSALQRDGRFNDDIFIKNCALMDCQSDTVYQMSECVVDDYKNMSFMVILSKIRQMQDRQDTQTNDTTATNAACSAVKETSVEQHPEQHPVNTEHEITEQSTEASIAAIKSLIEELLLKQYTGLLQQLKQQKNLKRNTQIKKFFRAEYDKSSQSFSEVKKVRKLTNLFDSVCQIRTDGSAKGTGFLLFNRFILTNAHVIRLFNPKQFNPTDFTAVFGYEDLDTETKRVQIKNLTSYFYGKDDKGNHLDYALLELNLVDSVGIAGYPELLSHYRCNTPDNRSEICIIGHPDGGVKKMDPCFVVGKERRQEAENKHVSENIQFYHVMSKQSVEDKWDFHKNQIALNSCFFHGSSGSPVFDADCKLIGVYTGGYVYMEEGKTRSVIEYAYSLQPILDNIKAKAKIKGLTEVLSILEKAQESTAEQQNQPDVEMENVEGLSPE